MGVAVLSLSFREIYAPFVDSHGGAGFHSTASDAVLRDGFRQASGCRLSDSSARKLNLSDVHQSVKKCSCRDDDRLCPEFSS